MAEIIDSFTDEDECEVSLIHTQRGYAVKLVHVPTGNIFPSAKFYPELSPAQSEFDKLKEFTTIA